MIADVEVEQVPFTFLSSSVSLLAVFDFPLEIVERARGFGLVHF